MNDIIKDKLKDFDSLIKSLRKDVEGGKRVVFVSVTYEKDHIEFETFISQPMLTHEFLGALDIIKYDTIEQSDVNIKDILDKDKKWK